MSHIQYVMAQPKGFRHTSYWHSLPLNVKVGAPLNFGFCARSTAPTAMPSRATRRCTVSPPDFKVRRRRSSEPAYFCVYQSSIHNCKILKIECHIYSWVATRIFDLHRTSLRRFFENSRKRRIAAGF